MRALLIVAGLAACGVGIGLLFAPVGFREGVGVALATDASALSEARAPGAALLAAGAVMLLGASRVWARRAGLGTSALVFLSFGAGRLVGFALDGLPSTALVVAAGVELLLGVVSLWALRAGPGGWPRKIAGSISPLGPPG